MVKKMLGPFIFKVQIVFRPKIYVVEGFRLYITASFKALLLLAWLFLRAVSDKTRQTRTHASPLPSRISSILSQFALETCASAAPRPTEELEEIRQRSFGPGVYMYCAHTFVVSICIFTALLNIFYIREVFWYRFNDISWIFSQGTSDKHVKRRRKWCVGEHYRSTWTRQLNEEK